MFFPGLYFDPMYLIFALPALLLGLYAQMKIRTSYSKYLRVANSRGITGLNAARYLLDNAGLYDVEIEGTPGELSDHYDPSSRKLRLSRGVANSASVAALGIVAHEVGHAVQHAEGYGPLRLRSAIVPVVSIGTWLGPILFIIGFLLQAYDLAVLGVIAFAGAAVFSLVTLPVELNASSRAMQMLTQTGLVTRQEYNGAKSVLSAAALTYVAAAAQSISTLLYYVFLLGGLRRSD
ncbi:MAG: zinc metallopeptidase [Chloroflexi bacterium]|nr:zinc metallopeptidase [Chloroflexota bacterium]